MIVHLPSGRWRVVSKKGRNLGTYRSKAEAKKRLRQVEFFKFRGWGRKKSDLESAHMMICLGEIQAPTYSEVLRKLHKDSPDDIVPFMKSFKEAFDEAYEEGLENKEGAALLQAMFSIIGK